MDFSPEWMNLNETRDYPLEDGKAGNIPTGFISDMQIFTSAGSDSSVDDSADKIRVVETNSFSGSSFPFVVGATLTPYMATVVVRCGGCTLFCTRARDDVRAYEPVPFVSEDGTATGWIAFGSFSGMSPFRFSSDGSSGKLDPRAVVVYPSCKIGGFRVGSSQVVVSGNVKFTGGPGIDSSVDVDSNTVSLSLNPESVSDMSDPCRSREEEKSLPEACSVNGVAPNNGLIALVFTGRRLLDADVSSGEVDVSEVKSALGEMVFGGTNDDVDVDLRAFRRQLDESDPVFGFVYDDRVYVVLSIGPQGSSEPVYIDGYRFVYNTPERRDLGLLRRSLEFSFYTGYHLPEYDIWTRRDMLPPVAELFRNVRRYRRVRYGNTTSIVTYDFTPYSDESVVIGKLDTGNPWRLQIAHRFRNTLVDLGCTAFFEVLYRIGDDMRRKLLHKDVEFSPYVDVDVPVVLSDEFERDHHGYEALYMSANRYDTDAGVVVRPDVFEANQE